MEYTHQTFFIDMPESVRVPPCEFQEELVKVIKDYDIEEYLLALELDPKIHFHFIVFTSTANCINLVQHLVRKYNLSNTSGKKGGKRKYGRLKKPIDNLQKLKIYCSKEGNVLSSYSNETLEELYKLSFKKHDNIKSKLVHYLDNYFTDMHGYLDRKSIMLKIINYLQDNKIHIRRSLVDSYYLYYRQTTMKDKIRFTCENIFDELYPHMDYA